MYHPPAQAAQLIAEGNCTAVSYLLRHGFDPNAVLSNGHTPLGLAVQHQQVDMIRLLLAHGAWVKSPNADGHTALALAERQDDQEVYRMLFAHH